MLDNREVVLPEGEPRLESGAVSLQAAASAATKRLLIGCSYPGGQTPFRKRAKERGGVNNETKFI